MQATNASSRLGFLIVPSLTLLLTLAGGCSTNAVTGSLQFSPISREQEIAMGEEAAPKFEQEFGGPVADARLQQYVAEVGGKVAARSDRPMPYAFKLVRSKIPNAFALPGGKVFVTAGLMALMKNERQLAAVLGHEVGHVSYEHNIDGMKRQMGVAIFAKLVGAAAGASTEKVAQVVGAMAAMKYGRDDEYEADAIGIKYLALAGYNPWGMVELLELLLSLHDKEPSRLEAMFQTHPLTSERVARAKAEIVQKHPSATASTPDPKTLYFQAMRQRLLHVVPEVK